jgi:glycosyltransferase involved in cell wall biosynthesis
MNGLPIVSVVVPCYNYGRFLPDCVSSILTQEGVRTRILIIDDCSTDDSADVGYRLSQQFDDVEFRRHETNRGHIATYNEGLLEWADGEYVTLLSADDELTPGSLARSVGIMQANPTVGMVYGGIDEFGEGFPPRTSSRGAHGSIIYDRRVWLRKRCLQAVNVVPTPGTVLRTSAQITAGGYDPLLPHAGDFEMWLRVAARTDIGYVRGEPQGRYRLHDASMSYGVYQDRFGDVAQRKLVFDSIFRRFPSEVAAAEIVTDRVYAKMASQSLWWACRLYEKSADPDLGEVERCVQFAETAFPGFAKLRAYRALQRRQRIGAPFCHRTQLFAGTAIVRKLQNMHWWFRWRRYGG